ncbi:hypothetical protein B0H13DRAFT_2056026 [Mycena leptocephala]|nr:hypothetical protein B0H13DRAFT_2056026 [Mycena leptocephala]
MISEGHDKGSNLDFSISLSLSSPRISSFPESRALLSVFSMLPDGFSDTELLQSNLPINDLLSHKAALIQVSLAYTDDQKRTKILAPIREYMQNFHPTPFNLISTLLKYFQQLLEARIEYLGTLGGVGQSSINFANIQNVLLNSINQEHPDLANIIHCTCNLAKFSRLTGAGKIPLMTQGLNILPSLNDHGLVVSFITELFDSWRYYQIPNPTMLVEEVLDHFHHFSDAQLQCSFYNSIGEYYLQHDNNVFAAMNFYHKALAASISAKNVGQQSEILYSMAWIK